MTAADEESSPDAQRPSERGAMYRVAVDRPVATTMIVCAVCVFGILSYGRLHLALMPELTYPTLTVRTDYPGAAPEEVEREVAKPIEETLRTVEDLAGISSISRAETTDVVLEFRWGSDMDYVTQKVRERIDMLRLPDGVERPMVLRYDPELDPIIRLGVTGDPDLVDLTELRRYAEEEVKRALEKIEGVAMVRVSGGEEPIIRIELDEEALAQRGLSAAQVIDRLRQENVNLAGGRLDDGTIEYLVRTLAEFTDLSDLSTLIVGQQGSVPVRLEQVATIAQGVRDREVITRIGPDESVEVEVFKEADANIVEVAERVRTAVFGEDAPIEPGVQRGETDDDDAAGGESGGSSGPRGPRGPPALIDDLPDNTRIEILSDRSVFIRAAIDEVVDTALLGGVLAVLILFLFLRSFYVTTTIALAIPLSLVVTFAALYLAGVTLNIMSLGGLALGIGMLVDNAVVVLESIHRCREEGDGPRDASVRGALEVGGAVVASTLTTIAVFFPIVFVEGVAGQVFGDLALSVVFSLLASLVVALFFIPTVAARSPRSALDKLVTRVRSARGEREGDDADSGDTPGAAPSHEGWRRLSTLRGVEQELSRIKTSWRAASTLRRPLLALWHLVWLPYRVVRTLVSLVVEIVWRIVSAIVSVVGWVVVRLGGALAWLVAKVLQPVLWAFERGFSALRRAYAWVLDAALDQRLAVILIAGALSWVTVVLYEDLGTELIPTVHQGELQIDIALPVEAALPETAARSSEIERQLAQLESVRGTSTVVGVRDESGADSEEGANTAAITVLLVEADDLATLEENAIDQIRAVLSNQAGIDYDIRRPTLFSLRTPVEVQLSSDELPSLREASRVTVAALEKLDGVTDVRSSLTRGYPEIHVRLDRDAIAARGLDAREVANAVRQTVQGVAPTAFRSQDRRLDILVRLDRADIVDRTDLSGLTVKASDARGPAVALETVADISPPTEGPSEIRRIEGQRVALIEAAPDGVDLESAVETIERTLEETALPRDVQTTIAGQSREMETARNSLTLALVLAIFLVYIVMAARFESLAGPFVILLTIPLAGIGVVGALWLTNTPISIVVFIGVIMLAGIVVNNAIVLVDYIIQLRGRGYERREAITRACEVRLRPVLITTLTTVFGLLPLALGLGEGAEIRAPMATAVMAGLASSTLLTLVVVPVVYDLIGELGRGAATLPSGADQAAEAGQ